MRGIFTTLFFAFSVLRCASASPLGYEPPTTSCNQDLAESNQPYLVLIFCAGGVDASIVSGTALMDNSDGTFCIIPNTPFGTQYATAVSSPAQMDTYLIEDGYGLCLCGFDNTGDASAPLGNLFYAGQKCPAGFCESSVAGTCSANTLISSATSSFSMPLFAAVIATVAFALSGIAAQYSSL